jgi:hypothetical protein
MDGAEESDAVLEIVLSEPGQERSHPELEIAFEAFGVPILVTANRAELIERFRPYLPPGHRPRRAGKPEERFTLLLLPNGKYGVAQEGKGIAKGLDLELALELLDSQVRVFIGRKAPDAIFVHAGAVGFRDRAIVLPGASFSGKTSLVAALVEAGATYYSDEFAVVDEHGLVHPYPKALSVRGEDLMQTHHQVSSLGWIPGEDPLPIGLIAVTRYHRGALWRPRRLSPGEGALALFANTIPAQERPAESMRALKRAAQTAVVIESDRDEATSVVAALLAELGA